MKASDMVAEQALKYKATYERMSQNTNDIGHPIDKSAMAAQSARVFAAYQALEMMAFKLQEKGM